MTTAGTRSEMWEQYRKTLVATQLFVLSICGLLIYTHAPFTSVALFFVVMQLAALIGARWAARLRRKMAESKSDQDDLPLRPR